MINSVRQRDRGRIEHLVRTGSNINMKDNDGNTPLHVASLLQDDEMIKTLLSFNANGNIVDSRGFTFLDLAYKLDFDNIINFGKIAFIPERNLSLFQPRKFDGYFFFYTLLTFIIRCRFNLP